MNKTWLGEILIGHERSIGKWTIGLEGQGGILKIPHEKDRSYWSVRAHADLELSENIVFGPAVQFGGSNQESFVSELRNGEPVAYDKEGVNVQLVLSIGG